MVASSGRPGERRGSRRARALGFLPPSRRGRPPTAPRTAGSQTTSAPHEDFYAGGWGLGELTALTAHAAQVLGRQVEHYGDDRLIRDDEGADPYERLREARRHLVEMAAALDKANTAAQRYHSAIGHIGVQVDPAGSEPG